MQVIDRVGSRYHVFEAFDDEHPYDDGSLPKMGQAWLASSPTYPTIWAVETGRPYRRQGVARAVMLAVIEEARCLGAERVGLACTVGNTPAEKLYGSLGFQRDTPGHSWWSLPLTKGES